MYYPNYYNPYVVQGQQQMVPTQPQQVQPQQMQIPQGLKGRPVSSIDEARVAQIDFDGSLFLFPDVANKKIYTKQINLDGTASLNEYILQEVQAAAPAYVTRDELEKALAELKSQITSKESPKATSAITF